MACVVVTGTIYKPVTLTALVISHNSNFSGLGVAGPEMGQEIRKMRQLVGQANNNNGARMGHVSRSESPLVLGQIVA